ncbi:hypothetical protein ACFP81_06490 [Deinococcus lacus]|uniref:VRR-NUC domain-containing protein n=1 Tax=Deinococcus lacus TaxID=392561 RepID=A0ABW1YFQ2_9DEIO
MTRHPRAAHLRPATEKEVVSACVDRFLLAGWYPVRTEANNIGRGTALRNGKPRPGALPPGFPDYLFTKGLVGTGLGLVAFVEFKRADGTLTQGQRHQHQLLNQGYGQAVHVVRSLEEAEAVIALGERLEALLGKVRP